VLQVWKLPDTHGIAAQHYVESSEQEYLIARRHKSQRWKEFFKYRLTRNAVGVYKSASLIEREMKAL